MRRRFLCWLAEQWYALRAKYETWVLFRAQPWREQQAKRRTP